ncbi:PRC-barrel domain containing protein [Halomarina ordinaria]|uniref:PRC-barrel domain containing protein n=1 Tax=Halomarina ordinaria TaxID=3033939 RepID=A0ABD5UFQ7_9EURY|nr:PRC-barrel domain containing protein [Halomarina sp. PSRA2]
MSVRDITEDDEGKKVVDARGETVGRVVDVEHGTAHVDPDPGVTDTVMSKLGWGDSDEDTYPLQEASIAEVTDDEIRLDDL